MYVYGQLTAPKPDRKAITVTPITPTRLNVFKENFELNQLLQYIKEVSFVSAIFDFITVKPRLIDREISNFLTHNFCIIRAPYT
jgi:hypothetical protein